MRNNDQLDTTVVVGIGYTGQRLLARLPATRIGLGRTNIRGERVAQLDLDHPASWPAPLAEPGQSALSIVYTVPPSTVAEPDPRIQRLLGLLPRVPQRFVYISTTGVYGDRQGARVAETAKPAPATDRARRRSHAEDLLRKWSAEQDVDLVVLRVPGIYGPGRLGLERIRAGHPILREQDCNPGNRIHVDDLVSCCLAALDRGTAPGIYNVADGDERSSSWFTLEVARQAGLAAPPVISRAAAEQQFSAARLSFLNESRRLDLGKMHGVLRPGIKYTDAADGIAASL
ncbi:MAG TPA: NAD-dependent epimerase/dehydratase family protein [Woeseiaceae bacterium]|nr:NAD-dependent epimerase/dehydratase family protein [Woeseiaceae bacterium]